MSESKEVFTYPAVCPCLKVTEFKWEDFPFEETKICEKCGKKIRFKAHDERSIFVYYGV